MLAGGKYNFDGVRKNPNKLGLKKQFFQKYTFPQG